MIPDEIGFKGTKGTAVIAPRACAVNIGSLKVKLVYPSAGAACVTAMDMWAETEKHDKQLIFEAFNVANRTGLTPEQMESKIRWLEIKAKTPKNIRLHVAETLNDIDGKTIEEMSQTLKEAIDLLKSAKDQIYTYERRIWEEGGASEQELDSIMAKSESMKAFDEFFTKINQ